MKNYYKFINEKKDDILSKILKFFKDEYIAKKAIDLHPKLSIWIINQFKNLFLEIESDKYTKSEAEEYIKSGKSKNPNIKSSITEFWNEISSQFQSIIDWAQSFDITPEERKSITNLTFDDAFEKSENWHESLKAGGVIENESGTVLMTFPDGFYWIDLESNYDGDEADAMGHCGKTNKGDTLYSLRDRNKSPHITAAIDSETGIIYQMKGRNNYKPIEKYHKYIVALLTNNELKLKGFGSEYNKREDFSPSDLNKDLYDELLKKRPNINMNVFTDEDIKRMFISCLEYNSYDDFRNIEWIFQISQNIQEISYCTSYDGIEELYDILCIEFKDIIIDWLVEYDPKQILVNFTSLYIDSNFIIKKYNLNIDKTLSSIKKWSMIYDEIEYDEIMKIIKNDNEYDRLIQYIKNGKLKDYLISYSNLDFEKILILFFGDNISAQWKGLCDLFGDEDNKYKYKYSNKIFEIWDNDSVIEYLANNTSRHEQEEELDANQYPDYVGEDD
jgi:hypothetical protein